MNEKRDLSLLLARVEELEADLDVAPFRRGQLLADLLTVVIVAPIGVAIDWHARPLLLVGLMLAAVGLNRMVGHLRRLPVRRERDRLLAELSSASGEPDPGQRAMSVRRHD